MNHINYKCANKDMRIACMEYGIKFWQIAVQLGTYPEAISRALRVELEPEEKKKHFGAIEQIIRGR